MVSTVSEEAAAKRQPLMAFVAASTRTGWPPTGCTLLTWPSAVMVTSRRTLPLSSMRRAIVGYAGITLVFTSRPVPCSWPRIDRGSSRKSRAAMTAKERVRFDQRASTSNSYERSSSAIDCGIFNSFGSTLVTKVRRAGRTGAGSEALELRSPAPVRKARSLLAFSCSFECEFSADLPRFASDVCCVPVFRDENDTCVRNTYGSEHGRARDSARHFACHRRFHLESLRS